MEYLAAPGWRRDRRGRAEVRRRLPADYSTLSVIMPVFNERSTVAEIIRRMRAVEIPSCCR